MPDRNHNQTKDTQNVGKTPDHMTPQENAENRPGDHQGTKDRRDQGEQSGKGDRPSRDRR